MTDLFLDIPVSGRGCADGRSPSARPITVFDYPSPRLRQIRFRAVAIVQFRSVSVVIVGTPQHVNLLAVSLLIVEVFVGPIVRGPHRNLPAPAASYQQGERIAPTIPAV